MGFGRSMNSRIRQVFGQFEGSINVLKVSSLSTQILKEIRVKSATVLSLGIKHLMATRLVESISNVFSIKVLSVSAVMVFTRPPIQIMRSKFVSDDDLRWADGSGSVVISEPSKLILESPMDGGGKLLVDGLDLVRGEARLMVEVLAVLLVIARLIALAYDIFGVAEIFLLKESIVDFRSSIDLLEDCVCSSCEDLIVDCIVVVMLELMFVIWVLILLTLEWVDAVVDLTSAICLSKFSTIFRMRDIVDVEMTGVVADADLVDVNDDDDDDNDVVVRLLVALRF